MKREPTIIEKRSQSRIVQLIAEFCEGSQQVFADKVGIGKSSVSQYVNGTNFPTNVRAAQIAESFNVSPMWVMGFDVPMYDKDNNCIFEHEGINDLIEAAKGNTPEHIKIAADLLKRLKDEK